MTTWSPQQDAALAAVSDWLADPSRQVFRLFGYAGTGKTTLARHLGEQQDGRVQYCAYTGKAALVMRNADCPGARTIHSLIYIGKSKSRLKLLEMQNELASLIEQNSEEMRVSMRIGMLRRLIEEETKSVKQPAFTLNPDSDLSGADLLIIDEVSMVDERMGKDLLSFGIKTLVLGDPAQLPPVFGAGYFTNCEPDVLLTEIHRQARDNPIIDLATQVREGVHVLPLGKYGDSEVVAKADVDPERFMEADQILVGRNATRHGFNRRMRARLGREGMFPVEGDKLLCLRNDRETGVLNGSLWRTDACVVIDGERLALSVTSVDGEDNHVDCEAWTCHFEGTEKGDFYRMRDANEFDYGYALTVHKAQGSQWDDVVLMDEWNMRDSRRAWLYTAITRAAKRVTVVVP